MQLISTSREAKCATERFCFPLNGKLESKKKWLENNDLFIDSNGKILALVETIERVYFMDAITGSLYEFGNCQTSRALKIHGVKRNKILASNVLMNKKITNETDEANSQ